MDLPAGHAVPIAWDRSRLGLRNRDKMGEVLLTVRWREALDVLFNNCERLLWSCLDVAEGVDSGR
jgi:hypothetical protein